MMLIGLSIAAVLVGVATLVLGVRSCWRALWNQPNTRRAWGYGLGSAGGFILLAGGYMALYGLADWLKLGVVAFVLLVAAGSLLVVRAGPPLALRGADLAAHRHRVMGITGPLGAGALLVSVLAMPAIALFGGTEGEAHHVFTASLPTGEKGAYLVTARGAMQLYDWYSQPPEFPSDAPVLATDELQQVAVVQKQFDEISKYPLVNLTTGERILWQRTDRKGTQLLLDPVLPLKPGDYRFVRSTDSPYGESTIHYFRLK